MRSLLTTALALTTCAALATPGVADTPVDFVVRQCMTHAAIVPMLPDFSHIDVSPQALANRVSHCSHTYGEGHARDIQFVVNTLRLAPHETVHAQNKFQMCLFNIGTINFRGMRHGPDAPNGPPIEELEACLEGLESPIIGRYEVSLSHILHPNANRVMVRYGR